MSDDDRATPAVDEMSERYADALLSLKQLTRLYYDGSWNFNSYYRIKEGPELMSDIVHWLEITAGIKVSKEPRE